MKQIKRTGCYQWLQSLVNEIEEYQMKNNLILLIYRWAKIGLFCALIFSLLGYLGSYFQYFELVSHFRLQYFVVAAIVLVLFILKMDWKWCFLTICCLVINGIEVIPWYYSGAGESTISTDNTAKYLRVLHANVHTNNKEYSRIIKLINTEKPDLVFLQETDGKWLNAMKEIESEFPFQIFSPRSDNFGIALYSRIPFVDSKIIEDFSQSFLPSIYIEIEVQNKIVSILSTHPLPPVGVRYFEERNFQLDKVAEFLSNKPHEKILIGDLNATMWSPYFNKLIQKTGMINVRKGIGILPSWPTNLPFLKIPLDHCLVGKAIRIVGVKLGDNIGSDHLPLIVDLAIKR